MDAHFNEYLAAVAGMADVYGTPDDGFAATFGSAEVELPAFAAEASAAVVEQR